MSNARDDILAKIRQSKGRGPLDAESQAQLTQRLRSRPRGIIPARAQVSPDALVEDFKTRATEVHAEVRDIASLEDVPAAVADYLTKHNQAADIKIAPHPDLTGVDWSKRPTLTISQGPSDGSDKTSVTRAFAGIAESGTMMLLAGPEAPTTLNFLPENHIVVLKRSEIVGAYEEAWDLVRDKTGPDGLLSRVVNMITGPSRTGDIAQTLELGAHGPLRVHILVVAD